MTFLAVSLPVLALACYVVTVALILLIAFATAAMLDCVVRRIRASVDGTIARLPSELEDEWALEWRAELAAAMETPFTAARLAQGLRQSGSQLMGSPQRPAARQRLRVAKSRTSGTGPEEALTAARLRRLDLTIAIIAASYVVVCILGSTASLLALFAVLALYATAADVIGVYAAVLVAMVGGGLVVVVVMSAEEVVETVRRWCSAARSRRVVRRAWASTR